MSQEGKNLRKKRKRIAHFIYTHEFSFTYSEHIKANTYKTNLVFLLHNYGSGTADLPGARAAAGAARPCRSHFQAQGSGVSQPLGVGFGPGHALLAFGGSLPFPHPDGAAGHVGRRGRGVSQTTPYPVGCPRGPCPSGEAEPCTNPTRRG